MITMGLYGTVEDPLFLAADVGRALGIVDVRESISCFPDQTMRLLPTSGNGGSRVCVYLTEAGLYRILFKSRKPIALLFQDYICDLLKNIRLDVIRKTPLIVAEAAETEAQYQQLLEQAVNGSHQRNPFGITDVTTKAYHIEIKEWKAYKHALGQILFYNEGDRRMRLYACFYGTPPANVMEVVAVFHANAIEVMEFDPHDNTVLIKYAREGTVERAPMTVMLSSRNE